MTKNRKKVEEYILNIISKLSSDNFNTDLYKNMFKKMNDKEFHEFMLTLKSKKRILNFIVPHNGSVKIKLRNNLKVGKQLGINFFQRLVLKSEEGTEYLTPEKHLTFHLPTRRTRQHAVKGIAVPTDSSKRNALTGQVINESRASKITFQELQILNALGLKNTMKELMMLRSGNVDATHMMNTKLENKGYVTLDEIEPYVSESGSTKSLKAFLKAAHIELK